VVVACAGKKRQDLFARQALDEAGQARQLLLGVGLLGILLGLGLTQVPLLVERLEALHDPSDRSTTSIAMCLACGGGQAYTGELEDDLGVVGLLVEPRLAAGQLLLHVDQSRADLVDVIAHPLFLRGHQTNQLRYGASALSHSTHECGGRVRTREAGRMSLDSTEIFPFRPEGALPSLSLLMWRGRSEMVDLARRRIQSASSSALTPCKIYTHPMLTSAKHTTHDTHERQRAVPWPSWPALC